jgi:hypothetical protein
MSVILYIFRHSVHLPCPASVLVAIKSEISLLQRELLQCIYRVFFMFGSPFIVFVPTAPRQWKVAETVCQVPDAAISYMCSWWWVELPPETCRESSLQKNNELYIVASCWTVADITCRLSHFINYCGFCLHTTPAVNRSSKSFGSECTETLIIGSSSVSVALQPNFWPPSSTSFHSSLL